MKAGVFFCKKLSTNRQSRTFLSDCDDYNTCFHLIIRKGSDLEFLNLKVFQHIHRRLFILFYVHYKISSFKFLNEQMLMSLHLHFFTVTWKFYVRFSCFDNAHKTCEAKKIIIHCSSIHASVHSFLSIFCVFQLICF